MPANKNALIRYKTIDGCLRNRYRRYTLDDLAEACSEALYEMEGISKGVSLRTVQGDIQIMRSDKLGYNAPIEVYNHKYYRYEDPDYSITNMPLTQNDYEVMTEAVDMLRQLGDFEQFAEISDVISRLQDKLSIAKYNRKPLIHFDSVPDLKGLKYLNPLYNYIAKQLVISVKYKSFRAQKITEIMLSPYLLKEFRNRWFVFGTNHENHKIQNLALDRIVNVEQSNLPFIENGKFDADTFFNDMIGVSRSLDDKLSRIRFWASAEQSNYIKTKPLHHSQKIISEDADNHTCVFEIEVIINFEMYSVFMSYGAGIKILSPVSAVGYMRNQLNAARALYEE
jgi:predicted DNA-binding transcriptional regulator YafY